MKNTRKSIASVMAVCVLFGVLCMVPSSAQQFQSKSLFATPCQVEWTYISSTSVGLTKSYLVRLNISADTDCYDIVDHCGVTATLQKLNNGVWEYYDQWSATSTAECPSYCALTAKKYVLSGTFRVVSSHSATAGNTTEFASMISSTITA